MGRSSTATLYRPLKTTARIVLLDMSPLFFSRLLVDGIIWIYLSSHAFVVERGGGANLGFMSDKRPLCREVVGPSYWPILWLPDPAVDGHVLELKHDWVCKWGRELRSLMPQSMKNCAENVEWTGCSRELFNGLFEYPQARGPCCSILEICRPRAERQSTQPDAVLL